MTWFKVDDGFWSHPKTMQLPDQDRLAAIGLWVSAGAWCAKYNTYGRVPKVFLTGLAHAPESLAVALVSAGLWRETDDGWAFVHWRKWQDGDYRKNIPVRVRAAVMERDGYTCVLCGATDNLSLDHIIRYRDDGPDTVENLRVLCMPCNLERG